MASTFYIVYNGHGESMPLHAGTKTGTSGMGVGYA